MSTEKLEAALRALGWEPVAGFRSVATRAWKLIGDERPNVGVIYVPRADWIAPGIARRILRTASRIAFR